MTWLEEFLLKIMVRIGRYLGYNAISIFAPGVDKDPAAPVRAIHFATSERWLSRAVQEYRENEK